MSTNEQLLSAIDDLLDAAENFGLSEHPAVERVKAALNSPAPASGSEAPVAVPLDEAAIRADERARCAKAFEAEVDSWLVMRKAGLLGAIKRRGVAAIRGTDVKLEGGE